MQNHKQICALQICAVALAGLWIGAVGGCAGFARCSPENCTTDRTTLSQINELLASHRELGAPAAIHVQVINGVVYLSGQVSTDLEIRSAQSLVLQVTGVKDVVNSLNTLGNSR